MINWDKFEQKNIFKNLTPLQAIEDQKVRVMPVVTARGCTGCTLSFCFLE